MAKKHPCEGCIYKGVLLTKVPCCNYIFMEDKRRPCPPGEGCTVKTINKEVKVQKEKKRRELSIEQKRRKAERDKAYQKKRRAERVKLCRHCGKEFHPSVDRHLFCSDECAAAHDAENRKKWDKAKYQKKKAAKENKNENCA